MSGRVAFVPLRYGPQIVGGSEALTREIAMGLAGRGWDVEVLTTRVIDHQSMADELPEGESHEDGLTVRRFTVQHHWSAPGLKAQRQIQDGVLPAVDDQWTWVSWRFTMPDLFHHLLRHGDSYDAVVFSPYMFWHTTVGISAVRSNAVVMPCLHDESYARMSVMRPVLADPASVWFLSEPEHELAHRLGPVADRHRVTGAGIHVPAGYDPDPFSPWPHTTLTTLRGDFTWDVTSQLCEEWRLRRGAVLRWVRDWYAEHGITGLPAAAAQLPPISPHPPASADRTGPCS